MKKRELKKRIKNGFEELAPNISEAVIKTAKEQGLTVFQAESTEQAVRIERKIGENKKRKSFWSGNNFRKRLPKYSVAMCTVIMVLFLCIYGNIKKDQDSVYMVVDINPSIRIEMNHSCKVKHLEALDQDGKNVIEQLEWKRNEMVGDLMDVLIEKTVEKSYLKEDGGILLTFFASDEGIYEKLENITENRIQQKLAELRIFGVTIAVQRTEVLDHSEGRRILEDELMGTYGLPEEEVRQMSVIELIEKCQDSLPLKLKISDKPKDNREGTAVGDTKNGKAETIPDEMPQKKSAKSENHEEKENYNRIAENKISTESVSDQNTEDADINTDVTIPAETSVPNQQEDSQPQPPETKTVADENSNKNTDAPVLPEASASNQQENSGEQNSGTKSSKKKKSKKKKAKQKKAKQKKAKQKKRNIRRLYAYRNNG